MGDLLTYQSDNPTILELLENGIHFSEHLLKNFNIHQNQFFPVIGKSEHPTVYMLKWGIENPIMPEGQKLTYIFGDSIEKQESLIYLLRNQRILIPVKQFLHRRNGNEPDVLISHPEDKILWMTGLWYEGKNSQKGFALITQNSTRAGRKDLRRIPVFLSDKNQIKQWLSGNSSNVPKMSQLYQKDATGYSIKVLGDVVQV